MRVVHIFPHLMPGGAERVLVHIMTHLDRSRFDVSAICLAGPCGSDLEAMLERAHVPVQFLGKRPGFDPRMFGRVTRALLQADADVIHSHVHVLRYVYPYILYSRFLRHRPRMLHTVHSLAEFEVEPRARFIQRLSFRAGVIPVAVAQEVSQSLTRLYGVPPAAVVPNCLPVERYCRPAVARSHWRAEAGFAYDTPLVTCVAGLRPEKNHELLLQAFARSSAAARDAHLLLAGGGKTEDLQQLAAALGIAERVHFLGVRTDIPDLLAASDLFVLASKYEGNPLCIMEAMAAGLPVIAPRVGGIPELVTDGVEGLLVEPSQIESLARALDVLLADRKLQARFGAASLKRAFAQFDVRHMVAGYQALYEAPLPAASVPAEQVSEVTR